MAPDPEFWTAILLGCCEAGAKGRGTVIARIHGPADGVDRGRRSGRARARLRAHMP